MRWRYRAPASCDLVVGPQSRLAAPPSTCLQLASELGDKHGRTIPSRGSLSAGIASAFAPTSLRSVICPIRRDRFGLRADIQFVRALVASNSTIWRLSPVGTTRQTVAPAVAPAVPGGGVAPPSRMGGGSRVLGRDFAPTRARTSKTEKREEFRRVGKAERNPSLGLARPVLSLQFEGRRFETTSKETP
jgi:hypothetical protein